MASLAEKIVNKEVLALSTLVLEIISAICGLIGWIAAAFVAAHFVIKYW